MANDGKFLNLENGKKKLDSAIDSSAGVADSGKIIKLDSSGKIDITLLPDGVGEDAIEIVSSEDLSAGDFVNIFNNGGSVAVRQADRSNSRDANGFVLESVTSPNPVKVFFEGTNSELSGLTIGARYYLDTTGNVTGTPTTTTGDIHQYLGKAFSVTELTTEKADCIVIG
ncbi:MAG: hypothetical protein ACTSPI_15855 [Candidatus Heimdallarchaeaceae archaeon]